MGCLPINTGLMARSSIHHSTRDIDARAAAEWYAAATAFIQQLRKNYGVDRQAEGIDTVRLVEPDELTRAAQAWAALEHRRDQIGLTAGRWLHDLERHERLAPPSFCRPTPCARHSGRSPGGPTCRSSSWWRARSMRRPRPGWKTTAPTASRCTHATAKRRSSPGTSSSQARSAPREDRHRPAHPCVPGGRQHPALPCRQPDSSTCVLRCGHGSATQDPHGCDRLGECRPDH